VGPAMHCEVEEHEPIMYVIKPTHVSVKGFVVA